MDVISLQLKNDSTPTRVSRTQNKSDRDARDQSAA